MSAERPSDGFLDVYERYCALIWRIIRRRGLSAEEAEDVFEASVLSLLELFERTGRDSAAISPAVVIAITYRRIVDSSRDKHRRRAESDEALDSSKADGEAPDEVFARRELAQLVAAAIRQLPATCREVLEMRIHEELPFSEIAERLGVTQTAANVRFFRCLRQLRRRLGLTDGDNGGDEE